MTTYQHEEAVTNKDAVPLCHTHTGAPTPTQISLLPITSLSTAVPGCLICGVPPPPCGVGDLCRHPTHCSTHAGSLLGNINAIRQEPNGSDLIGLAQIVPQRRRIKIYHRQIPKQRLPRPGCEVPAKVTQHLLLGKARGRTWYRVYDP